MIRWRSTAQFSSGRLRFINARFDELSRDQYEDLFFAVESELSLMGVGPNRREAREDLLREARELAASMAGDDVATLSAQAAQLREFVLRVR